MEDNSGNRSGCMFIENLINLKIKIRIKQTNLSLWKTNILVNLQDITIKLKKINIKKLHI